MRTLLPIAPILVLAALPAHAQHRLSAAYGAFPRAHQGAVVCVVADLDGDGCAEWMSARDGTSPDEPGPELRVHSGRTGALLFEVEGFGTISTLFLQSLADLGDVDGDGVHDVGFGNSNASVGGVNFTGRVAVHSGRTGERLYTVDGPVPAGAFGASLAALGDVDGDGRPDFVVGQIGSLDENAYVVSGASGAILFHVDGPGGGDWEFGWTACAAGDADGDGVPDFAVGSRRSRIVLVFSGATGVRLLRVSGSETYGRIVADLGDATGDGFHELAIAEPGLGLVHVIEARGGRLLGTIQVGGVEALARAGDLDGDGVPDLLIGDGQAESAAGLVQAFSLRTFTPLFRLVGAPRERFGTSLAGGADHDGDGWPDFVVGAPFADAAARGADVGASSTWSVLPRRRGFADGR